MKARLRAARAVLGAALLVSAASTASANDKPPTERPSKAATDEARERFKRGVDLFRDGDYRAALIEFNRAIQVAPNAKIHYNIAQTCLEMQDYACALRAFERYLAEAGADIPKDRRQLSEREVERLKKLVGYVRITSNKDGAEVTIDDAVVGRTPLVDPVLVGAGRHKVTLSLAPLNPATRVVDVAGGDRLDVAVDLAERAPEPPVVVPVVADGRVRPASPAVPLPPAEAPPPSRTPFWIGLVTTGVLGVGTGVTGALALSAKSDLDATANRFPVSPDDVDSAQSKVRTFSTVTDILLVSTIVAAGITTVLYFTTSPPSRSAARARPLGPLLGGAF